MALVRRASERARARAVHPRSMGCAGRLAETRLSSVLPCCIHFAVTLQLVTYAHMHASYTHAFTKRVVSPLWPEESECVARAGPLWRA